MFPWCIVCTLTFDQALRADLVAADHTYEVDAGLLPLEREGVQCHGRQLLPQHDIARHIHYFHNNFAITAGTLHLEGKAAGGGIRVHPEYNSAQWQRLGLMAVVASASALKGQLNHHPTSISHYIQCHILSKTTSIPL